MPAPERRDYGRYALTMYPAGHCLGSAQILVEADGERLVYTGDIKLRPNVAARDAVVVPCDTLVMESTFGDPQYRFPPDVATHDRLYAACDRALSDERVPVVLAYALGKSQEALELLLRRGYRVTLHGSVWNVSEIYRECGWISGGTRVRAGNVEGAAHQHQAAADAEPQLPRVLICSRWAVQSAPTYRDVAWCALSATRLRRPRPPRPRIRRPASPMHGAKKFAASCAN